MAKTPFYAPVLVAILATCGSDEGLPTIEGPVDGDAAYAHVEKLVACNPRHAGSPGAKAAAEYLKGQLDAMGVAAEIQEFQANPQVTTENGERMVLRNVIGRVPTADASAPILIFGAHYDTKRTVGHEDPAHNFEFEGAIDGGGANGVLLELARHVKDRDNAVHVWFVFFDGEESVPWVWENTLALLGSRHFVQTMDTAVRARVKAFINIDLIGDPNFKIDRDGKSSKALQDIFARVAKEFDAERVVYKYDSSTTDDHLSFTNYGIPAALLIDFRHRIPGTEKPADGEEYTEWWHTAEDNLSNLSADTLAFTGNLLWQSMGELEEHLLKGGR